MKLNLNLDGAPRNVYMELFAALLEKYKDNAYHIEYYGKLFQYFHTVINTDKKTLRFEFQAGVNVANIGTTLYAIQGVTGLTCFATFNECHMEVRYNG